jgi:hypothetical protein
MIVMMVFGLGAVAVSNPTPLLLPNAKSQWLLPGVCGALLIAVVATTLLLLNSRTGGRIIQLLKRLLWPLPERIRNKTADILDQIAIFQTAGWRFHLIFTLVTIVDTLAGGVATYVLAAWTASIVAPMSAFVWLCALVYILGRLPISIANLGVREVTMVGFLAVYGAAKPAAMLMSMILFSSLVFMAVVGAAYQLYWTLTARKRAKLPDQQAL